MKKIIDEKPLMPNGNLEKKTKRIKLKQKIF